jgi:acetyl-CoA acetyltransferase
MTGAMIVGTGATRCGRFLDRSLRDAAAEAVQAALTDADVGGDEVEAVFVGNGLAGLIEGQECIRGEVYLQDTELQGLPIVNCENACASGSSALHLACMAIASGSYETVVVLGAEKMAHAEKTRPLEALKGARDVSVPVPADPRRSVFMDHYAEKARAHRARSGWTAEDLARVVVTSRRHGALNPIAQFREETTVDEVLAARMIVDPLTLPMCSPIGDGAAALVLTGAAGAKGREGVRVLASAIRTATRSGSVVERAARAAYEQAGLGAEDVDVVEIHDAAASVELEELEHLGFAPEGHGHELVRLGDTALGGRIPVNTSGGLLSRGHPIGATGVLQVAELVEQLRDRAQSRQVRPTPRHALAQNAGGVLHGDSAVAVVTLLGA